MHFCRFYHDADALPRTVSELLENEAFAGFFGDVHLVRDSAGAASDPVINNSIGVPENYEPLRSAVQRMMSTAGFRHLTNGNRELSERLAHDAVHWCDNQWLQSTSNGATDEEADECRRFSLAPTDAATVEEIVSEVLSRRPALQTLAESAWRLTVAGMSKRTDSAPGAGDPDDRIATLQRGVTVAAVKRRLLSEWQTLIDRDRTTNLTMTIRRAFAGFVAELEATVPLLAQRQSIVRDLFGSEDPLWDLSPGEWQSLPWRSLEDTAAMLGEHEELIRLAEVLGRSKVVTQERTSVREEREVRVESVGIGKSEVTGTRFGDDLTSLLPSEMALLSDPETEELFYAKLAHKELLVLDYRREKVVFHTRRRPVTVREEVTVPRGPVVLCVDTSGSMIGLPEKVAKAMTLALAQRVGIDRRPVHVICFSTDTRSFELTPGISALSQLATFLGSTFRGGTDLRPALSNALELLETNRFNHADVLVISDFRVPKIVDRFLAQLSRQQARGTLFHSLTIADRPVTDPMHIFDRSYHFDVSSAEPGIDPKSIHFFD